MRPVVIIAGVVAILVGWILLRPPAQTRMDSSEAVARNSTVSDELLPPAAIQADSPAVQVEEQRTTNFMTLLRDGDLPDLTADQLKTYLESNHRNAESLLAAYRATRDRALLDEALTNYPNDPRVAYVAWFRSNPDAGDPDALKARREALDRLKHAAPDNALANYLSAANYFKSGQPEEAVKEMMSGAAKGQYDDYTQSDIQRMKEAYLAVGYPEAVAKGMATSGALLPHLSELKQAGVSLVELANSYQQAGDADSARAALQMCLDLGQRLNDPGSMTLIQILVGIAIQRRGLEAGSAGASDAATAQAYQDQLRALEQQRAEIKELAAGLQIETWLQTAQPEDVSAYFDRMRIFGEQQALLWLANRQ